MIFDAHGDILTDIYEESKKGNKDSFRTKHYPLYVKGGISHSIFVNWTDPYQKTKEDFDKTFDVAIDELKKSSDIVKICLNYDDVKKAQEEHKLGVILGIEGLKYLESPESIKDLYDRGVRHAIITWNEENEYATGVAETESGLKDKGRDLLSWMEHLGMIIDLSHANPKTFEDVMNYTCGPIIVSHGNAKSLCDHRRNYSDEQLMRLKERDGVIGVCAVPNFISKNPELQTVEYLAKHIDYIAKLIGIDHVGLGLDVYYYLMDGKTDTGVKGLETMEQAQAILDVLRTMGYSDQDLSKIAHDNFDRILFKVLN